VFALPEEVDAVGGGDETTGDLGPADGVVEQRLEASRQREVGHLPARGAHQMVVVVADGLGQLVPGEVVAGAHAHHNARLFEGGEIAVERALRQAGGAAEDLDDGEWRPGVGEELDYAATRRGVALSCRSQLPADGVVHGVAVGRPGHRRAPTSDVTPKTPAATSTIVPPGATSSARAAVRPAMTQATPMAIAHRRAAAND